MVEIRASRHVAVRATRCGTRRVEGWHEVQGEPTFELCLVRAGCFRYRDERGEILVDPGSGVFGAPFQPGEVCHPAPGGDLATFVLVSPTAVAAVGSGAVDLPLGVHTAPSVDRAHWRLLAGALRDADGAEADEVEEQALAVFAAALAQREPARARARLPRTERARRRLVDDARELLVADPSVADLVDLASRVGSSPHHLSRLFVAQTGMGVARYRMRLRVLRALDRLRDRGVPLAEVAADCGFADHAHMTRSLRRHLGTTPSRLRAELAEQRVGQQ
jgi:AraC-like DNA-binding protein